MSGKTAILLGASGLTGSFCLKYLLEDPSYDHVKIFVRKHLDMEHEKLEQQAINFDQIANYADDIRGDDVFCCLGTTIKKADSEEAYYKVDHIYPYEFGRCAKNNGAKQYILMSSIGANPNANNFYFRVKGEVEKAIESLDYDTLIIVRPSMLLGSRKEFRFNELIGKFLLFFFAPLLQGPLKKYRGIFAETVARAMVKLAGNQIKGVKVVASEELKQVVS